MKDPVIAAGAAHAFLGAKDGPLRAYALDDGHQVWTKDIRTALPPVVGEDLLFVVQDGELLALDQSTGHERWHVSSGDMARAPLHQAGWLFFSAKDGSLVALRSADGSEVWRQALGAPTAAAMSVDGDQLFAPLTDGRLVSLAINAAGTQLWSCMLDSPGGSPLAAGDRVYLGSAKGLFYSVKEKNGRLDWQHKRIGTPVIGRPVLDGERVFIATLDSRVVAIDRGGGAQLWWEPLNARPVEQLTIESDHLLVPLTSGEIAIVSEKTGKSIAPIAPPASSGVRLAAPMAVGGSAGALHLLRITMGTDAVPVLESFTQQKK